MDNFDKKPIESIRGIVNDKLSFILFNKNDKTKYKLVGSSAYRLNKYYGDLDIIETYADGYSIPTVLGKFIKRLRSIVSSIQKKKLHYLTDFKAGVDSRFAIKIIITKDSSARDVTIKNAQTVARRITGLISENLIPNDIGNKILDIVTPEPPFTYKPVDIEDYFFVKEYLRRAATVRWNYQEIMSGRKTLIGDVKITLKDALLQKTLIKLDYVTTLGGQFIEVTNFIVLGYVSNNYIFQYNLQEHTLIRDLRLDIDKFLFSDYHYDPFKAIKRMFNLSRILWSINKTPTIRDEIKGYMDTLISPLLKSDVSYLSKLQSGISTMITLIDKGYSIPKTTFKSHLDILSFNLPNCTLLTQQDIKDANKIFDRLAKMFSIGGTSKHFSKNVLNLLNKLSALFQTNINYFTVSYMRNKGYITRPNIALFLPKKSVTVGIINEVPLDKSDVERIIETATSEPKVEIIALPNDNDLLVPVGSAEIPQTFESLTNDEHLFDILGVKQETMLTDAELAAMQSDVENIVGQYYGDYTQQVKAQEDAELYQAVSKISDDYYDDYFKKVKAQEDAELYQAVSKITDDYYKDIDAGDITNSELSNPGSIISLDLLDVTIPEEIPIVQDSSSPFIHSDLMDINLNVLPSDLGPVSEFWKNVTSEYNKKLSKETQKIIKDYYYGLVDTGKITLPSTTGSRELVLYEAPTSYEVTPKVYYPSSIEEPSEDLIVAVMNNVLDMEGPIVEEIKEPSLDGIDFVLIESMLGPIRRYKSVGEYFYKMSLLINSIYSDIIKGIIKGKKFKSPKAKHKFIFNELIGCEIRKQYNLGPDPQSYTKNYWKKK